MNNNGDNNVDNNDSNELILSIV